MSNPDEIREDIERTRAELSENVNALGDSAKPGNIARGQVDKVKDKVDDVKTRVFGAPDDPWDEGAVGEAKASAQHAVADARQTVAEAPRKVGNQARGNPLAAGLVALGIGALIGGLIPPSRTEKDIAHDLKDRAQPLVDEARSMAMEAKENLQPAAEQAVESVKQSAGAATENVKADAVHAKDQVADEAAAAAEHVRADTKGAVDQTRGDLQ